MSVNKVKVKGNIGIQKKLQNYQTVKKNWLKIFFQKLFLKNNNETNKQKQNISLNPKKNPLDTVHGKVFKAKQ